MVHVRRRQLVSADDDARPCWSVVLRALREARGITQEAWAGQLGYARSTVRRWEQGSAVPTATAEAALVVLCREKGLLRTFEHGPLAGVSVTAAFLEELLTEARTGAGSEPAGAALQRGAAAARFSLLGPPSNLPLALTGLIGRDEAVDEVASLFDEARLVTLTGVGGVGKTRLALAVAERMEGATADGAFFVDLSPLADPELVGSTIAGALGVSESPERPIVDTLKAYLRDRRLLLVLDNFEHLLGAAPLVTELLAAARGLWVLVTSRAPLRLAAEREYPVPTLSLPDVSAPEGTSPVERIASVALFVERARGVRPDFRLTVGNVATVAEICRRLDGLPLALELAAARLRILDPEALLARLDERLALLVGGRRDAPARQRTLRDTIVWSYDLLGEGEQRVFRRLAVFAGGCSLDAAEAVCGSEQRIMTGIAAGTGADDRDARCPVPADPGVLEAIASLVEKNLVRREGDERFGMLESLRLFAFEQLSASGEEDAMRDRLAMYVLALAEEAAPRLTTTEQRAWLRRLEAERDNLRAALARLRDRGAVEPWLRLAGSLAWFWQLRGHYREGRAWLTEALAAVHASIPAIVRARALYGAGLLAVYAGDYGAARPLLDEALALARSGGERGIAARTLFFLGLSAWFQGDVRGARIFGDEAVAIGRELADSWIIAQTLAIFALLAWREGGLDVAWRESQEGLALARISGDGWATSFHLTTLGRIAAQWGDLIGARAYLEEALALRREGGYAFFTAHSLAALGDVERRAGNLDVAASHIEEALALFRDLGNLPGVALCLVGIAGLRAEQGEAPAAARLLGAAEAVRDAVGADLSLVNRADYERTVTGLRATLGEGDFAAAWAEGRDLGVDAPAALAPPARDARSGDR